jgi:DNA-binding XRE family transcriptional regulator
MSATSPAATIRPLELRRDLDLSRERMARLFDVSAKTIERWERSQSLPSSRRVMIQLAQLKEMRDLGLMVYTPEGFRLFMRSPLPDLGGQTPLQMIEQGKIEEVIGALAGDYEGLGF